MKKKIKQERLYIRVDKKVKESIKLQAESEGLDMSEYLLTLHADSMKGKEKKEDIDFFETDNELKKNRVVVLFSNNGYLNLVGKAQRSGLSVSAYVRRSIKKSEIIIVPGLKELARQLSYIGNNINQLTRLAHENRIKMIEFKKTEEKLEMIWRELNRLAREK